VGIVSRSTGAGSGLVSAAVTLSAQAAGLATGAVIPFDTVVFDPSGYFDAANHRFVVPAGQGGSFLVGLCFIASALGAGADMAIAQVSNTGPDTNSQAGAPKRASDSTATPCVTMAIRLSAGNNADAHVFFSGGGTTTVSTNNAMFWIAKLL
jgi:hypothetical protein